MSYVFFDLEWNQGYPRSEVERLDEIIQIGACRLSDWQAEGETFSAYVRPTIHRKLHHRVRKMLPLEMEAMFRADRFPDVISRFFDWCGEDALFFTWGPSDAKVLDLNLIWYGLEEYLTLEVYDLQRAYDIMIMGSDQQTGLKDAAQALGLDTDLEFHNASNDACYTALIGAEMVRRLGELPTEEELNRREEELARQRREQVSREALAQLEQLFAQEEPLLEWNLGTFSTQEDCLKSRSARGFRCPKCDTRLCNGNWHRLGAYSVARCRCVDHGRFYSVIHQAPRGTGWQGTCRVFDNDVFPVPLFSACKLCGESVVVSKLPGKRRRSRRHGRKLTVKPTKSRDPSDGAAAR